MRPASSRTYYFLLAGKHGIRAEIGQAAPGFYFVRNLRLRPGEWEQAQNQHRQDRWDRWGRGSRGTGKYMLVIGAIILVAWLLTRIPGVRNRLRKINR